MKTKYGEAKDGEWFYPIHRGFKHQCCDCGLVHRVDFKVTKLGIKVRFFRDNRSTSQVRRHRK